MKGFMRTCVVIVVMGLLKITSANAISLSITPTSQTVGLGDLASAEVWVNDLGDEIVAAYGLDLLYDETILNATDVAFGAGLNLGDPFYSTFGADLSEPGKVHFHEASYLSDLILMDDQPDDFVLATISFDTVDVGTSALTLVVNDDPLFHDVKGLNNGVLAFDFVGDGHITVAEDLNPVPSPEPATFSLFGVGMIGMLGYGWYRRREA